MAKQQHTTIRSGGTSAGAAAARELEPVAALSRAIGPVAETATVALAPGNEEIARLAYSYWQARGCPEGSPEEDWLRAEATLRQPAAATEA
jgi:DUF2934 family protein